MTPIRCTKSLFQPEALAMDESPNAPKRTRREMTKRLYRFVNQIYTEVECKCRSTFFNMNVPCT